MPLKSRRLSPAFLIALAIPLLAADSPKAFRPTPHFTKDQIIVYDVRNEQSKEKTGRTISRSTTTYRLTIHVIEPPAGAKGATLEWEISDLKLLAPADPTGETKAILEAAACKVRYTTAPDGTVKSLDNWDEVKAAALKMLEKIASTKPEADRPQLLADAKANAEKPDFKDAVERAALSEPKILHALFAKDFRPSAAWEDATLESPVTHTDLPARAMRSLTEDPAGTVKLRENLALEKAAAGATASAMGKAVGKIEMSVVTDATFKRDGSLPTTLTYERIAILGDGRERMMLELKEVSK